MLLIHRPESGDVWPAHFLSAVVFIACEGAQDRATGRKLDEAFRRGGTEGVRSLRFGGAPGQSDWVRGDGWALTTEAER
jgi:protein-L-isoaspartate(D-aspartate) O-methyltransferase